MSRSRRRRSLAALRRGASPFLVMSVAALSGAAGFAGCSSAKGPASGYQPPDTFDAHPDAGGSTADGSTDVPPPPPVTGPGAFRVVSGTTSLLRKGPPCTSDAGAPGDTWCGFLAPSRFSPGAVALYVVNLSAALAGTAISCGGVTPDPNCLLLTSGYVEDDTHGGFFQGSTLVYFDSTATPYGWRPGMVNGRRLAVVTSSSGDVHDCMPARTGNAVLCLHDVPAPADTPDSSTATYSELLVGPVDAASPPLPSLGTVISNDDADDQQRFQVKFVGKNSERIAWSSRAVASGPEILNQQLIGDPTTRTVVATDVSKWTVSGDATHWGWLSVYNYNGSKPSGTLQLANFPDGSAPVTVMPATATYAFTLGRGLAILGVSKTLVGVVDPVNAPTAVVTLDDDVISILSVGKLGHLAYVKDYDFVFGLADLYVQMYDGTGMTCSLDRSDEVPVGSGLAPRFLPGGAALLWSRVTNLDTTDPRLMAAGRFTNLATCATTNVDSDVVTMGALGDAGIVFTNSYDGSSGTLLTRGVVGGTMLSVGTATVVQTRTDSSLSLYPFLNALAYTVNVGDPSDGLYLYPVAAPN